MYDVCFVCSYGEWCKIYLSILWWAASVLRGFYRLYVTFSPPFPHPSLRSPTLQPPQPPLVNELPPLHPTRPFSATLPRPLFPPLAGSQYKQVKDSEKEHELRVVGLAAEKVCHLLG